TNSLMNDCKSEIKWLEAAMLGVPSIVSPTHTHRETIKHGVTGFLCESTAEFTDALDQMIGNPALRKSIAAAAYVDVNDRYSVATLSKNLKSIFTSLPLKRKKRLLIVNVFYPPQSIGGATRVVHDNVVDLLERYGDEFSIDVVCTLEGGATPLNIDVYSIEG